MVTPLQLQYLQLLNLDGFPHHSFSRFIKNAGSISALVGADEALFAEFGLDEQQRSRILSRVYDSNQAARETVGDACRWLEGDSNRRLLCFEDPAYPALLKESDCPPPLLFVLGDPGLLSEPQLAIVGSRKASRHGNQVAHWLASELAAAGLAVTSGLAAGIDSQAHRGALAAGGRTLAVIGTGIDRTYPSHNRALAADIVSEGALVSEFPLGTPPLPGNFPQRNRIIAALSLGVIVVEAAPRSGSLITARLAMEANREVFAVPGSLFNSNARGCHKLIQQGAKLIDSVDCVLEELQLQRPGQESAAAESGTTPLPPAVEAPSYASQPGAPRSLTVDEKQLLDLLEYDPCPPDYLVTRSTMSVGQISRILSALELKGLVEKVGARYQRVAESAVHLKFDPD